MNKNKLKSYAPAARRDFIQAVTDRANAVGLFSEQNILPMEIKGEVVFIGGKSFPKKVAEQRKKLEQRIGRDGFDQAMEAMAYTWFNRFVAIRYMEIHDFLDHGFRVLSNRNGNNIPEILEHATDISFPGLRSEEVLELKIDGNRDVELYTMLLVAQCNALHNAMPFLFERIGGETELLLPDNILHSDSLIHKLVTEIDENDWNEVEIIGWLYQFYISEKKDQVIGKVVKSEDIPAATQLFTPNWIVKYMVQNTLGSQWLATYPKSPIRNKMQFYIEPCGQSEGTIEQISQHTPKDLNPESITFLDPACGSGHILVEAYDLLKQIYSERGYRTRDIPRLILEKNLYGFDIDERAAQLAGFALMMKARADDQSLLRSKKPPCLNIIDGKGTKQPKLASAIEMIKRISKDNASHRSTANLISQKTLEALNQVVSELEQFDSIGSLTGKSWRNSALGSELNECLNGIEKLDNSIFHPLVDSIREVVRLFKLLSGTYDHVVTNPPYMGCKYFDTPVRTYIWNNYSDGKGDLFACFILRNIQFCKDNGYISMITIPNWMFLSSFETLRHSIIDNCTIQSFVHNGRGVWGADFGSCSFVLRNFAIPTYVARYKKLFDRQGSVSTSDELVRRFFEQDHYIASSEDLMQIPGRPIAYWISDRVRKVFRHGIPMNDIAAPRQGLATSDNDRFLRLWYEVPFNKIHFNCSDRAESLSHKLKWFPFSKGGKFRRWYGNLEYVINWENDGEEVLSYAKQLYGSPTRTIKNIKHYFHPGITWSDLTISYFNARILPKGFIFDTTGPTMFLNDSEMINVLLGYVNSSVFQSLLLISQQGVHYSNGVIATLPFIKTNNYGDVEKIVSEMVSISKRDWDSIETSWDFEITPMLSEHLHGTGIYEAFANYESLCKKNVDRIIELENQNNLLFMKQYDLMNEFSHEVTEELVSINRVSLDSEVKRFISYAIGCMMGRYSLDRRGLIYANHGNIDFDPSKYVTFPAVSDGILPINEQEWFAEEAANRVKEFLSVSWIEGNSEDKLRFFSANLAPKPGETPKDTIRRYLSNGFYKDHLQAYKRRPIYWLFSSGKEKAFQCLVYLHRYNEGTLSRMRNEYVTPLFGKMNARIDYLKHDIEVASSTSARNKLQKQLESLKKKLAELTAFDDELRHYADKRIKLDLDDGVKVNYGKFGKLLAEVKAVTGE